MRKVAGIISIPLDREWLDREWLDREWLDREQYAINIALIAREVAAKRESIEADSTWVAFGMTDADVKAGEARDVPARFGSDGPSRRVTGTGARGRPMQILVSGTPRDAARGAIGARGATGRQARWTAVNAADVTRGDTESMAEKTQNQQDYAGDLSPLQAWELLAQDRAAVLVDVRSRPEWSFVGVPDLSRLAKKPLLVAWQHWTPNAQGAVMAANEAFAEEVAAVAPSKDAPVIFLCRSGVRSRAAAVAMTRLGYAHAYNLAGGFEGTHDPARHRGRVDGWKAAGLPWTQD